MSNHPTPYSAAAQASQRLAQLGLVINALLAVVKLVAGLVGNAYALVADAIDSGTDIIGSVVVWGRLRIASRDPDDRYPFEYGRAEALAGAVVSALMVEARPDGTLALRLLVDCVLAIDVSVRRARPGAPLERGQQCGSVPSGIAARSVVSGMAAGYTRGLFTIRLATAVS